MERFPFHGFLGIFFLVLSEIFLFKKIEPVYSWFYCFAWWSYIFAIDGIIYRIRGNSLVATRTREFFLMIPWSIFIWLIFEAANLFLQNWYYINLPHSLVERWLGYAVAFGTVLPGLFLTTELLEAAGLFRNMRTRRLLLSNRTHHLFMVLGGMGLSLSVLLPRFFFGLIWLGFTFLLDPVNDRYGGRSLLRDLREGNPRKICLLLTAGFICGFLWEFWNYWSRSKWIYTVPFFQDSKGFEMPWLGFFGFPPFAVQAYVMYNFLSLFRFGRGWEESTFGLYPEQKTRTLTSILTGILMVSFFVLIFQRIDQFTVDSLYPRLKDAYWIEASYRTALPKVGIASFEDLVEKTRDRKEREELILRLLIPKEEFIPWIEKARLALLKGLGVENFRLLEAAGISSVADLALQEPERLHDRMRQASKFGEIPSLPKIRIWIREAQKTK